MFGFNRNRKNQKFTVKVTSMLIKCGRFYKPENAWDNRRMQEALMRFEAQGNYAICRDVCIIKIMYNGIEYEIECKPKEYERISVGDSITVCKQIDKVTGKEYFTICS